MTQMGRSMEPSRPSAVGYGNSDSVRLLLLQLLNSPIDELKGFSVRTFYTLDRLTWGPKDLDQGPSFSFGPNPCGEVDLGPASSGPCGLAELEAILEGPPLAVQVLPDGQVQAGPKETGGSCLSGVKGVGISSDTAYGNFVIYAQNEEDVP